MKNIKQYVRSLLFDQDYVTIPNFGAFIANYVPSDLNQVTGSLMPPHRKIAFNEILKQDDGLLTMYVARRQNISMSDAQKVVADFVDKIQKEISQHKSYEFEDIGYFSLNSNNKLVFEPYLKSNFLGESFGFDSIYPNKLKKSMAIQEESTIEFASMRTKVKSKQSKGFFNQFLYALPVVLLMSGLGAMIFINRSSDSKALSSFNPFDYFKSNTEISKPKVNIEPKKENYSKIVAVAQPEAPASTVVEEKANTTIEKEIRFKVVAGIFKSKSNAESLVKSLKKKGFSASDETWNSFYRVVASETTSEEEAKKVSDNLKTIIGENGVIIKK